MFLKSLEHHLQEKLKDKVKIKTFGTGESCLKKLDQKPDIVVLDYFLNSQDQHAMNGMQVLERIKLNYPDVYVIMLSGQDNMQVAVNSMKYGAFDYVIKNENALMKMQNILRNAIKAIRMAQQLKFYKRCVGILTSIITITIAAAIIHTM
jgi:DNA-binding NtrC family response regulator